MDMGVSSRRLIRFAEVPEPKGRPGKQGGSGATGPGKRVPSASQPWTEQPNHDRPGDLTQRERDGQRGEQWRGRPGFQLASELQAGHRRDHVRAADQYGFEREYGNL